LVNLTVSGGTLPYTYSWNNGIYTSQNLQNVPAGHYVVIITDNLTCTVSDSTDVNQPALITGSRQVSICATDSFFTGGAFQKIPGVYTDTLVATNSCDSILSTDLSLVNSFSAQLQRTICYGQKFQLNGHSYTLSGTYVDTLTSSAGCDSIVTLSLSVLPDIGLYASPDKATLLIGDTVTINVISSSTTGIITYTWSPTAGLSCWDCPSSVASPVGDTRYTVIAIDSNGCRDTVVVPIMVNGPSIFIPNVFTPNNDGANDFFEIYGNKNALRYLDVKIFDRWGEKVFESNDLNFKWDGMYKGRPLMPAVFVYTLQVVFADGHPEKLFKGSVTLMR
jgi:gliding motility-associated-like protein